MNRRMIFDAKTIHAVLISTLLGSVVACSEPSRDIRDIVDVVGNTQKDFLLGPEDVLDIVVWKNEDLSQKAVVVRPDGKISMPLIGEVMVGGRTANQLASQIASQLKEFKENPAVSVSVKEINSYFIYLVGEVVRPGKYPLKSYATVLQGVSLAGGFTNFASRRKMAVVRTITNGDGTQHQIRIPVPYDELVSGKGGIENFVLKSGDTIVVP